MQLSTDIAQSLRVLKVRVFCGCRVTLSAGCACVLCGVIFCVQPEGSIALDRFKSLQKRNIIEPRERSR